MRDPLIVIKTVYGSLSVTEKYLSDYILSRSSEIPRQSVYDLAEACGTSTATVSRFVKKLGYSSFQDFKVNLAGNKETGAGEFYEAIDESDSESEMVKKIFLGNMKSIEDTLSLLDMKRITEAVKKICSASRLVFFGIGSSGYIARDAAMRFSLLGFDSAAYTDPTEIIFNGSTAQRDHVVFGLSHSGRSRIPVKGCELARSKGAAVLGIANYRQTPLEKISDFFFCTSFPEQRVKIAAVTSRIAQMCILDAMYMLSTKCRNAEIDYEAVNSVTNETLRL